MNAFLRARRAFGFEYLISFRAEHSDAERDITGIEGLLFRNRRKSSRIFKVREISEHDFSNFPENREN